MLSILPILTAFSSITAAQTDQFYSITDDISAIVHSGTEDGGSLHSAGARLRGDGLGPSEHLGLSARNKCAHAAGPGEITSRGRA